MSDAPAPGPNPGPLHPDPKDELKVPLVPVVHPTRQKNDTPPPGVEEG
jgi:hypothetical protein